MRAADASQGAPGRTLSSQRGSIHANAIGPTPSMRAFIDARTPCAPRPPQRVRGNLLHSASGKATQGHSRPLKATQGHSRPLKATQGHSKATQRPLKGHSPVPRLQAHEARLESRETKLSRSPQQTSQAAPSPDKVPDEECHQDPSSSGPISSPIGPTRRQM